MKKTFTKFLFLTTAFCLCAPSFLSDTHPVACQAASSAKKHFAKTYSKITVGKQIRYRIKNLSSNETVQFSVSNKKKASIKKKTGLFTPKKPGKVTVYAKIYRKKKKKLCKLSTKVQIKKKNTKKKTTKKEENTENVKQNNYLPGAVFKAGNEINAWNFQVTLSCSRILLEEETKDSTLTLTSENDNSTELTACFSRLSENGKKIIYTLSDLSQEKLCPGDASMNGVYKVTSSLFADTLSVSYRERITNDSLAGFVTEIDNSPVKQALVTLKTSDSERTCTTDDNGYYLFEETKDPLSLTVEKSGYRPQTLTSVSASKKGRMCENFILKQETQNPFFFECRVLDENNQPIPDASVFIFPEKDGDQTLLSEKENLYSDKLSAKEAVCSSQTDEQGTLLFTDSETVSASPCSFISLSPQMQSDYSNSYLPETKNQTLLSADAFDASKNYCVYIAKNINIPGKETSAPQESDVSYQPVKWSFSFSSLATDSLCLQVQLTKCKKTSLENLYIKWDSKLSFSNCSYIKLQLYQADATEPFCEENISRSNLLQNSNNSKKPIFTTGASPLSVSLPDSLYYLKITAYSKENAILAASPVFPFLLQGGTIEPKEISLSDYKFSRAVVTVDCADIATDSSVTLSLCQKCNGQFFQIGQYVVSSFLENTSGGRESCFTLSKLHPENTYCITAKTAESSEQNMLEFSPSPNSLFDTAITAQLSAPALEIPCSYTAGAGACLLTDQTFPKKTNLFSVCYFSPQTLSKEFVRSSQNYPNSVIAIYSTDGTLSSLFLTNPSNSAALKKSDAAVIEIYTNQKLLQSSSFTSI